MRKIKNNSKISAIAAILLLTVSAITFILPTVASESNVTNAKEQYDAFRYAKDVTTYPYTSQLYSREGHAVTPSEGPLTNHTLWIKPIQRVTGTVVAEGKIWISYDSPVPTLKCLDAYTGETIWEKFSTSTFASTSAPYLELNNDRVSIGFLYVIFNDALVCYQASDGVQYWEVPISEFQSFIGNAPMGGGIGPLGPTSDKYIFVADYFGLYPEPLGSHVWAVTKGRSGGDIAWAASPIDNRTDYWTGGPAAYANDILYVGEYTANGRLNAFNATTGNLLWSVPTDGWLTYPIAVVDGVVYATFNPGQDALGGGLIAVDATTGTLQWEFDTDGAPMSNPIVYKDSVYVGSHIDNMLFALDKSTGDVQWSMHQGGGGRGTTLANGKLYGMAYGDTGFSGVTVEPGFFYCLDPDTKSLVWKYQLPDRGGYSRGFAVADGIAYAGDLNGKFYAFGMGPTTTELSVTGTNLVAGETIAIDGKIFDESPASLGAPIVNVPVSISVQNMGDSTSTTLEPATTDSMGRFLTQWTPTTEGAYTIMAKFDGTNSYGWSSRQTVVQVNPAPTPGNPIATEPAPLITTEVAIIAAVVVVAVIGIGAYWFLRKGQ